MKSLRLSITPGYVTVQVTSAFDTSRDTTGKSLAAVVPAMTIDDRMDLRDVCRLILNLSEPTAASDLVTRATQLDAQLRDRSATGIGVSLPDLTPTADDAELDARMLALDAHLTPAEQCGASSIAAAERHATRRR